MARRKTHAPLNVLINNRLVGRFDKGPSGAVSFQYNQSWLDWQHTFAVSLSLPLRADVAPISAPVTSRLLRRNRSQRPREPGTCGPATIATPLPGTALQEKHQ